MTTSFHRWRWGMASLAASLVLLLPAAQALAHTWAGNAHEARLAQCIRKAAGGRDWLEKTLWGLRDQEGGWIGAEIPNADGSHDLGPLQVNSWWVPRLAEAVGRPQYQVRRWLIHDACFNVRAARWIFLSDFAATHDYWKAVGIYHSVIGVRQRRYALSVARHLRERFGIGVFQTQSSGK